MFSKKNLRLRISHTTSVITSGVLVNNPTATLHLPSYDFTYALQNAHNTCSCADCVFLIWPSELRHFLSEILIRLDAHITPVPHVCCDENNEHDNGSY